MNVHFFCYGFTENSLNCLGISSMIRAIAAVSRLRLLILCLCLVAGILEVAMVSIRRRKHVELSPGRSSSSVTVPDMANGNISDTHEQTGKPVNVKEEKELIPNPPTKKQRKVVHVDPESPLEVHAYLMQLKEDNKLELGPMQRSEEVPVKEWMENYYPQVFTVFPQDPKVVFQFSENSKLSEFLYYLYCLFIFELRNIVFMDCRVSPEYVDSLGKVIKILEKQGFDCRFMRSELVVVEYMMKKQMEILMAEKDMVAARTIILEKKFQALASKKEAELNEKGKQPEGTEPQIGNLPKHWNVLQEDTGKKLRELNVLPYTALEEEYIEQILACHKKMLASKEEELKRIGLVLEKINQLHQGKATFSA
ncbi:hypothetical protein K2173_000558 [Erythroxylum novogranatense]|uniref:Uncharacterized protein n=1 Tax=Erythroxylum novogranatense TaxID=1862640 RepID=A0AAV8S7M7_9ROSI|nr:hypothetical protein K2173_000558 [Erythroxylum novogranatense]